MKKNTLEHDDRCQLCGREKPLTFHHLIPRTLHSNKWFKKRFTREDMRSRGIHLCRDCHNHIHTLYREKELGRRLNTLDALLEDDAIRTFVAWVKKRQ